ncbi:ATP-grasp ribosomal peptide maturase [Allosalinactinospora lopnorensis]|uniref:ATP-grasp ribosomal peptide maturase n=1 Tax=Allosalinactinospora lopnorensis TaxID=1352348 RepID=UPI001F160465|nr:ATP-grasp ribosomal peptide maturase [Allosalinactinospora lopnorensis]
MRSVYYRRPTQFALEEGMSGPERRFAYGEARFGFGGVLQALDCLWLNPAVATAAAEYKPRQLAAARQCGLRIPRTVITNDPEYAYAWASDLGRPFVYKPLSGVWHPEAGEIRILYTARLTDPAVVRDPALTRTAHMFQEWVDKRHEARSVVVGDQVYTVAIHARSNEGLVDWRADYDSHTYEPIELPADVRDGLVRLHRNLGLVYGACDLVATPDGGWVFLETNANGEWEWLEGEGGAPITGAIADVLQKGQA